MADVEKVIKGLKYLHDVKEWSVTESEQDANIRRNITAEALALLKAQEPRVLTIQDLRGYDKDTMWFETRHDGNLIQLTKDEIVALSFVGELHKWNEHGKSWRCWTSKPTDKQREAVKWDGA